MSDMNALLDMTLDDLADMPTFEPFLPGVHRVLLSMAQKEVNGSLAVEISLKLMETVELADSNAQPQEAGSETSVLCLMDNEFGQGNLKLIATPIGQATGESNIGKIIENTKDFECIVVTGQRKDKNDKEKVYTTITDIAVA